LQLIHGLWYECHFESVPVDKKFRAYDHALERVIVRHDLPRYQNTYLRCKFKRQLSKRELRESGLVNEPFQNPSATASGNNSLFAIALRSIQQCLRRDFHLLAG
jgi:hypothetical protein